MKFLEALSDNFMYYFVFSPPSSSALITFLSPQLEPPPIFLPPLLITYIVLFPNQVSSYSSAKVVLYIPCFCESPYSKLTSEDLE